MLSLRWDVSIGRVVSKGSLFWWLSSSHILHIAQWCPNIFKSRLSLTVSQYQHHTWHFLVLPRTFSSTLMCRGTPVGHLRTLKILRFRMHFALKIQQALYESTFRPFLQTHPCFNISTKLTAYRSFYMQI